MASAAVKPMEQMEELKQILIDLKQNTGVQVVNMVQESFKTMDAQRQVLQQELQDVKAQLNAMQETLNSLNQQPQLPVNYVIQVKNNHSIMKGLAEGLEKSISGLGKHIIPSSIWAFQKRTVIFPFSSSQSGASSNPSSSPSKVIYHSGSSNLSL